MTADPLAIALAASKPIGDAPRQPLEVELLLTESQRVSINQHKAFRDSINPPKPFDEIDLFVSELRNLEH